VRGARLEVTPKEFAYTRGCSIAT